MLTTCPKCGNGPVHRSQRRLYERIFSVFRWWPFRCKTCNARWLAFSAESYK